MTLGVATLGMDERSVAALDVVFKGPGKGAFVLADEASAQATVVDMDGANSADLWAAYRRRCPHRPTIVLSVCDAVPSDALILRKPLRIASLLQTLEEIARNWRRQTASAVLSSTPKGPAIAFPSSEQGGTKPRHHKSARDATRAMEQAAFGSYGELILDRARVDVGDSEAIKKLTYAPEEYTGGQIANETSAALRDGVAWEITAWAGRIIVLPGSNKVVTDLNDARLKPFCLLRATNLEAPMKVLASFEFRIRALRDPAELRTIEKQPPPSMQAASVDAFLWKLTAWVARGRVPVGTDPSLPVVLREWPNFTRLLVLPNSMRIAALWIDQPRSLSDTAKVLTIPLSHVLTFYSAARAIGLIALPERQADFLFQPQPIVENRRRGLLGRILDKLRGTVRLED